MLGVFFEMRAMSLSVKATPASLAIASRCRTVLLEPPMAMSSVKAFSKAFLVIRFRGSRL